MAKGKQTRTWRRPLARPVRMARLVGPVLAVLAVAVAGVAATGTSAAAPASSATDGVRTLTVSQSQGLSPAGQQVRVVGSGYDAGKGVYVALCVIPPPGTAPSPCGGGADREGTGGASAWVSSTPPPYAVGLTDPYGPGGTFDVVITVGAEVAPGVDCRIVPCGIVTRSDHVRTADRSQDVVVPVSFAADPPALPGPSGPSGPSTPAPEPPPPPPVPTTPAPTTTTAPTATTVVEDDGRRVGDGTRTVSIDRADGFAPEGAEVAVRGAGFPLDRGVYVSLCGPTPADGSAPPVCATGEGRSVWLSSNPPDYGVDLARPFEEDGTFEVVLALAPQLDDTTDCTVVECVVAVRDDDAVPSPAPTLALPVTFDGTSEADDAPDDTTIETDALAATAPDDDPAGGGGTPWWFLAVLVVGAGLGAWFATRHRRAGEAAP